MVSFNDGDGKIYRKHLIMVLGKIVEMQNMPEILHYKIVQNQYRESVAKFTSSKNS